MRPNRLTIPDARGHGAALRISRHPRERKVVLSHWKDGVCVASTPIELTEVPDLIGVLADALGDALDRPNDLVESERSRWAGLVSAVQSWVRPRLAQVTELRPIKGGSTALTVDDGVTGIVPRVAPPSDGGTDSPA